MFAFKLLKQQLPIPALLGVEPEVFTTSVISSFLAVVIWSAYTLFVVSRVIQEGGDDKSVDYAERKASYLPTYSVSTCTTHACICYCYVHNHLATCFHFTSLHHSIFSGQTTEPCGVSKVQADR